MKKHIVDENKVSANREFAKNVKFKLISSLIELLKS